MKRSVECVRVSCENFILFIFRGSCFMVCASVFVSKVREQLQNVHRVSRYAKQNTEHTVSSMRQWPFGKKICLHFAREIDTVRNVERDVDEWLSVDWDAEGCNAKTHSPFELCRSILSAMSFFQVIFRSFNWFRAIRFPTKRTDVLFNSLCRSLSVWRCPRAIGKIFCW